MVDCEELKSVTFNSNGLGEFNQKNLQETHCIIEAENVADHTGDLNVLLLGQIVEVKD